MQMMPFLSMAHCGRRSIEDINKDDDVEDVEDETADVVKVK